MTNDFYIGWQPDVPAPFARRIRRFIVILVAVVIIAGVGLVMSQQGFKDSVFEFGELTTIEGVFVTSPVPMLKVPQQGGGLQSVILVGSGKMGAERDIIMIEKKEGQSLEKKSVLLTGTRIYYDGKMLLELTDGTASFAGWGSPVRIPDLPVNDFGIVSVKGEILDPKCALGVMKPGEGKPHRSCAIRCISGGIPPVFRMTNKEGVSKYCILRGAQGESVNNDVLPFVADQVRICGRLQKEDDWLVLYTDPAEDILRLQPFWMNGDIPMCGE